MTTLHRPDAHTLTLTPIDGEQIAPIRVEPDSMVLVGRSAVCDVQLPDLSVSRRHATLADPGGVWLVTDLNSRGGVLVNARLIDPQTPVPVRNHDQLSIGPWTFRAHVGGENPMTRLAFDASEDGGEATGRVDTVTELPSLARRRLDLLIDSAARLYGSTSEGPLAEVIAEAARAGTGFPRAAVIRRAGADLELIAWAGESEPRSGEISRSLLSVASTGQVARLSSDAPIEHGHSIARMGVQAALCAPISLGAGVDAFLYLDDTRLDAQVEPDAAGFCQALCRIGGLALANQRRAALERLNAEIMRDVGAAAEAQRLLMPPGDGDCRGVQYAVRMRPGRYVAGDLFNIVPAPGGRVGVYLGDVAGKGVGAAILMATTQTMLNASLRMSADPVEVLRSVGRELAPMMPEGRFISLWLGVVDPATREILFVDAGHGHWLVRTGTDDAPARVQSVGGLPLGVDADAVYEADSLTLGTGGRVLLLSDGVIEQRSPRGEEFGLARTIETLTPGGSTDDDVARLFEAVSKHADTDRLEDDVTVASLAISASA